VPRFSFILDQVRWFDESVVWLGPADESPFRALTELAAQAHPGCSPYGGVHEDVVPHLTIGHEGGPAELRAAAEAVRPQLPIAAEATEVTLMLLHLIEETARHAGQADLLREAIDGTVGE
jgi:hypothetical protein